MRLLVGFLAVLLAVIPAAAQGAIQVLQARVADLDDVTGVWQLLGDPVRVRWQDLEVQAPRIRYDRNRRGITAEGGVTLLRPSERLIAHRLDYRLDTRWLEAEGEVTVIREAEGGTVVVQAPHLQADLRANRVEATDGVRGSYRDVRLYASTLSVDWDVGEAVARGQPEAQVEGVAVRAGFLRADLRSRVLYAAGGVRITDGRMAATAQEVEVRVPEGVAVLRGGVEVVRDGDRVTAPEVWYAYRDGRAWSVGRTRVVVRP
ncbi:MAG: hypothetical protein N0A24_10050 [Armatimonadetes bacterium]|nr:hypothetical protein [Armatimonadota bacterium]MDW8154518.1 hypothetical protein [Armatimonadota bacterium]